MEASGRAACVAWPRCVTCSEVFRVRLGSGCWVVSCLVRVVAMVASVRLAASADRDCVSRTD